MSIDWSRPIEAVHEDGRVVAAVYVGGYTGVPVLDVESIGDGLTKAQLETWGYTIRNVATPAAKYPDALVERAMGLVRSMALSAGASSVALDHFFTEARAIVGGQLAEVDADLVEAREIAADHALDDFHRDMVREGGSDDAPAVKSVLAAIKRGRALEREHADAGRQG